MRLRKRKIAREVLGAICLIMYQKNSTTKAQEVVVCLYSLRWVEISSGCLGGIYRIFIRREMKRFLVDLLQEINFPIFN